MPVTITYTDITALVANAAGKHVNAYISGTRIAEMWSDTLGNWYTSCWIGDHPSTRGIRGGMTSGQVIQCVEDHVRRQHPEIREHNYSIMLAVPATWRRPWDGTHLNMRECANCGHRELETSFHVERAQAGA